MPPNMKAIIAPLFCLLSTGNLGNIKFILLAKVLYAVCRLFVVYKILHGDDFQAIFYEVYVISIILIQITTFGIKVMVLHFRSSTFSNSNFVTT